MAQSHNTTTVTGRLTSDPELVRTSGEVAKAKLRIAVGQRRFVAESDSWETTDTDFFTVICWRDLATTVARSLQRGDRVIVTGRLDHREFEVRTEGDPTAVERRQVVEIVADDIGPSLRFDRWEKVLTRPSRDAAADRAPHPAAGDGADPDGPPADGDVAAAA